jgi:iron complex outermembrane receptor protein
MFRETPARGAKNTRAGTIQFVCCASLVLWAPRAHAAPTYETVVTAPQAAREDDTASASVITSDRTPRSAESLPQLLSELPGVTVTRYGSSGSLATLSLRGSSPNQVAVYMDGVPLDSALTGAVDLGMVPLSAVSRIEVYRGTSPLGFGSSAMGGVVALTSETPARSGAGLHSGAGSFATRFGGAELASVGQRLSVVARAALFRTQADFPYDSDNGTLFDPSDDRRLRRENNQLAQIDASLRATLSLGGRRSLALALAGLDRDQGLPARGTARSFEATLARRRAHASLTYVGRDDLGTGGQLRATLYGVGSQQRFADPRGEISFGGPARTRDNALGTGGTVVATWPVAAALHLQGLLDARQEKFWPHDELRADLRPPGSRQFAAAGLSSSLFVDPAALEVLLTLRAEAARDRISPSNLFPGRPAAVVVNNELLPIARLGLVASPSSGLRLRANGGSYARLPTLFERYGNGGNLLGNPRLLPERGESADVGASFATGEALRVQLDAALFGSRSRQLIMLQEGAYFAGFANLARARVLGGELSARAQFLRVAHLYLQATYTDARDRSDNTASRDRRLAGLPALRAYLRPELRALPLGAHVEAGLYGDVELTGARYADPSNLVQQPGRQVFGAGASLAYRPAGLRALFSAYNLGDARTVDVLEYPLPGRSFFVTLEFAYSPASPEERP